MENNNNEHNQIANSSEQESGARENEYFGLQLKSLSNAFAIPKLKTVKCDPGKLYQRHFFFFSFLSYTHLKTILLFGFAFF